MELYNSTVIAGVNDFKTLFPALADQWSHKNSFSPSDVVPGSDRKCLWVCDFGHEWETRVRVRAKMNSGCPECFRVSTRNPLSESALSCWDEIKNGIPVNEIQGLPRHDKYLWKCDAGHEWEASISNQNKRKNSCVLCAKKIKSTGTATVKQQLVDRESVAEWFSEGKQVSWLFDVDRNGFSADKLSAGSNRKVWWVCSAYKHYRVSAPVYVLKMNRTLRCNECYLLANSFVNSFSVLLGEWDYEKNTVAPESLSVSSAQNVHWVCARGHEWSTPLYSRTGGSPSGCPDCSAARTVSKKESSLSGWLKSVVPDGRTSVRNVVEGYELDFYSPLTKIAVEFNGLFWHNDNHKSRNYHFDKFEACRREGVQLIQIWEDDWDFRPEVVKAMLSHKFGLKGVRVFARKTSCVEVGVAEMNEFLDTNHIQGSVNGGIRFGLEYDGVLVAVAVFTRDVRNRTLNLSRYATSCNVVGGFSKILKYVENRYSENFNSVVTFSDNTVSLGKLYSDNGFILDALIPPDYMYVVNKRRVHKFNYRLKRFREDVKLVYVEGLSESELARLNKLNKVYDAGKIRWVKNFS